MVPDRDVCRITATALASGAFAWCLRACALPTALFLSYLIYLARRHHQPITMHHRWHHLHYIFMPIFMLIPSLHTAVL